MWAHARSDTRRIAALAAPALIVAVVVKALDRRRKRSEEAVQFQARIADAMLLDPALGRIAITATVTAPFQQHAPVTVEVRGQAAISCGGSDDGVAAGRLAPRGLAGC